MTHIVPGTTRKLLDSGTTPNQDNHHNGPPSPTHTFRKRLQLSGEVATSLLHCTAPNGLRSYHPVSHSYSRDLPLSISAHTPPSDMVHRETPHLGCCYFASQRRCLHSIQATVVRISRTPQLPVRSQIFESQKVSQTRCSSCSGTRIELHQLRSTASRLRLCNTPPIGPCEGPLPV